MIGQDAIGQCQFANKLHKALKFLRIIEIRCNGTELLCHLRKNGASHAVLTAPQVNGNQNGLNVCFKLRGQGQAHITHRRCSGNNERYRRRDGLLFTRIIPSRLHRETVFTDRNSQSHFLAKGTCCTHGVVKLGIFSGGAACGHPVSRQFNQTQLNVGACDIGNRFTDCHAARGSRIGNSQRCSFAHTHRFTAIAHKAQIRDSGVSHRHLPGAHHLITVNKTAHRTVTDRNEETLAAHRRVTQYIANRFSQINTFGIKFRKRLFDVCHRAMHARCFTQKHFHRHIYSRRFVFFACHDKRIVFTDST